MKELELIEIVLFRIDGSWTFLNVGTIFEVLEEKNMPIVGLIYRVRYKEYPALKIDGFHNPNSFKVFEEK